MKVKRTGLIIAALCWSAGNADTTMSLQASNGEVATETSAGLLISGSPASAGFNAHVIMPEGVTVTSVLPGALLDASGDFQLDYRIDAQGDLFVVAYSGTDAYVEDGELLQLTLVIAAPALPGLRSISFAASNSNSSVNSRHALSNIDGSESLAHSVSPGSFLIYTASSDFDGDGLPDAWEQSAGLDPQSATGNDGADGDPDNDGFDNASEYAAGSDPNDDRSKPDTVQRRPNIAPILDILLPDVEETTPAPTE